MSHPEDYCQKCKGENPIWFAPNKLWDSVMGGSAGIVCPNCFIKIAEKLGGIPVVWKLDIESTAEEQRG